ncbi:hypothetical protein K502DRAFT_228273 [Neoconidiobolus thromboides FSU 785]|nr:hypothetical protein K502DRAFT_228273 [Neoconidiobolus thromboides FSU 785]
MEEDEEIKINSTQPEHKKGNRNYPTSLIKSKGKKKENKDITPTPSMVGKSKDKNDSASMISQESKSEVGIQSDTLSSISTSSSVDLRGLLEKAYSVIAEKEKELDQAFKIKESLLNENLNLKNLLNELEDSLSTKSYTSSINKSPTRLSQMIDDSGDPITPTRQRFSRRNTEYKTEMDSLFELEKINSNLQSKLDQLSSDKQAYEVNERKKVEILEEEITFLRKEFDQSLAKIRELEENNEQLSQRIRRNSLSIPKPNPVVRSNTQSSQNPRPFTMADVPSPSKQYGYSNYEDNSILIEEPLSEEEEKELTISLMKEVKELEKVNRNIHSAKKEADNRILELQDSLFKLQSYVAGIQKMIHNTDAHMTIIENQSKQIAELTARLENQRGGLIGQLFSSSRSTVSSVSTNYSGTQRVKKSRPIFTVHDDPRFNKGSTIHKRAVSTSSINTSVVPAKKYSLLNGLEVEFDRNFNANSNRDKQQNIINWVHENNVQKGILKQSPEPVQSETGDYDPARLIDITNDLRSIDLSEFALRSIGPAVDSEADEDEDRAQEMVEENPIELHAERGWFTDETTPLAPRRQPNNPVGIVHIVRRCFGSIWKWCRFITLLFAAVGMAVYRGPDTDVADYYFD